MILFPDDYCECFAGYDFEAAYNRGKRLIIFDVDNTIVPHGAPADDNAREVFGRLKGLGFKLCAISNNGKERVKSFAEDSGGIGYIYKAGKPAAKGYIKALEAAGARKDEALFFGDQIFTDILGAKRAGIESVLVKPVDKSTDEIQIVLKRILEKPIIKAFFRERGLANPSYFS